MRRIPGGVIDLLLRNGLLRLKRVVLGPHVEAQVE